MTTRTFLVPRGKLCAALVVDAMNLAGVAPMPSLVEQWTEVELLVAYDWAMREHLNASDNRSVRRRPMPYFVRKSETRT